MAETISVGCCIAGGGPAGMMLGYLLAPTGVERRAALVLAAGRKNSRGREKAGLKVNEFVTPTDVMWCILSRIDDDTVATMGTFDTGRIVITINRGEYWQCGYGSPESRF